MRCSSLDSYVQLSKVEATYENSKWLLKQIACKNITDRLKQEHGCNGIDNNCYDEGK